MAVVRLRGQLRALADGRGEHHVDGASVVEVLRALEAGQPALAGWILDERGSIRRHINVFVNGEQSGASAPTAAADRIDVIPAISGGT